MFTLKGFLSMLRDVIVQDNLLLDLHEVFIYFCPEETGYIPSSVVGRYGEVSTVPVYRMQLHPLPQNCDIPKSIIEPIMG